MRMRVAVLCAFALIPNTARPQDITGDWQATLRGTRLSQRAAAKSRMRLRYQIVQAASPKRTVGAGNRWPAFALHWIASRYATQLGLEVTWRTAAGIQPRTDRLYFCSTCPRSSVG